MSRFAFAVFALILASGHADAFGQAERVWLSHRSNDPGKVVVCWTTAEPTESVVRFGRSAELGEEARIAGMRTLHHVEIPVMEKDAVYHYAVGPAEGALRGSFKSQPTEELRVAVVANWHTKADLTALVKDEIHLLTTAGDNIPRLWGRCEEGDAACWLPYADLIDAYPQLFCSTPFMPVLGNHDREIRPRGPEPPAEPVYDVEATAFRAFFELPDDEWKWRFEYPAFGARFLALDFHHIQDFGTTWQTCHAYAADSEQFRWYEQASAEPPPFQITLYNERNGSIRGRAEGGWHKLFRRGTACITGFGHFAERAELDGLLYFDTSLTGTGDKYPDPHSRALYSENNYVLLTFRQPANTLTIELKNLEGKALDRTLVRADGSVEHR